MASWNKLQYEKRICPWCLKEFLAKRFKRHFKKFCTHDCYSASRRGQKRDPEIVARASKAMRLTLSDPLVRAKISRSKKGKSHSLDTREKISRTKARLWSIGKGIRRHQSKYTSIKTGVEEISDSSYELRRFKALDSSPLIKTWTKKHGIIIHYRLHGRRHKYIPDILIKYHDGRIVLEEIKGFVFNKEQFASKNVAALLMTSMFENTTFRVVFGDQLEIVE